MCIFHRVPSSSSLAFGDWVALLVDREAAHRDSRRLTRPLAKARFKYVIFARRFVFHCPWNPDSRAVSMSSCPTCLTQH